MAAARQRVRARLITPRLAATAPEIPAARIPAKVAALMPRGPGVISAKAMISATSSSVIQPWRTISSLITGIMERPPKLHTPILKNTR